MGTMTTLPVCECSHAHALCVGDCHPRLYVEAAHRLNLHDAGEHQEQRDPYCSSCETELADAIAEHAWMGRAVKTWTGGNPYAPPDPQAPERDWYIDANGYVKAPS